MFKDLKIYKVNGKEVYQGITEDNLKVFLTQEEAVKVASDLKRRNVINDTNSLFLDKKDIREMNNVKLTPENIKKIGKRATVASVTTAMLFTPVGASAMEALADAPIIPTVQIAYADDEEEFTSDPVVVEDSKTESNSNSGSSEASSTSSESSSSESSSSESSSSSETSTTSSESSSSSEESAPVESSTTEVTESTPVESSSSEVTESTVTEESTATEGNTTVTEEPVVSNDSSYTETTETVVSDEELAKEEESCKDLVNEGTTVIQTENEFCAPVMVISYNDFHATTGQKIIENHGEMTEEEFQAKWEEAYKEGINYLYNEYMNSDKDHPVDICKIIEDKEGKEFIKEYQDIFYMIKDCDNEEFQAQLVNYFCEWMKEKLCIVETEHNISIEEMCKYEYSIETIVKIIEKEYCTSEKVTKKNKELIKKTRKYLEDHHKDLCPGYGYDYGYDYDNGKSYNNDQHKRNNNTTKKKKVKVVVEWKSGKQIVREIKVEEKIKVRWEKICKIREEYKQTQIEKWKEQQTKHWEETNIINTFTAPLNDLKSCLTLDDIIR